ncbi:Uu.00g036370.m01.CDS01 [Anthostomella pinea]|uniref:Uu.00g036370.m01.CDS01 n=1 Tax=Anthostomella pinea TaxID=933095 RepID=A0AAI8V9A4_9PEZI|nr:Uu.00g036370.m01.CDS01 [Anthostomella pinea]
MRVNRPSSAQGDPKGHGHESGFSTDGSAPHLPSAELEKCATDEAGSLRPPNDQPAKFESAEPIEMSGWTFYTLIFSVILASLLIALNATVLGTAIPAITSAFGTVDDVGWYASAYLIANCAMSPLVGRLYRTFPLKVMFVSFVVIFEIGSLIGGLSKSSPMLIVARAISGIGGSGILNGGQTIIAATVPIEKRAFWNGIILGCFALGQAIGPLIGGALTQEATWRWCFYLNLPVGGIVIFLFVVVVRLPVVKLSDKKMTVLERILEIDLIGFFTFAAACTMFLMGLQWGGTKYAWNSPTVIGLLSGGVVAFVILGCWFAHRGEAALIPPRLLQNRINVMITITSFVQSGATTTALYWLPVWFQAIKDANPLQSGVMILPLILSQLVASVVCGVLVQKTGYYLPEVIVGNALVAVGAGLTSTFSPSTTQSEIIGYQVLVGAGRGLVLQLLVTAIQANAPREDASIASAYAMFSQFLGGAFFTSIAKSIFTSSIGDALHQFAPGVDPDLLINSGVTDFIKILPQELLQGALLAYNQAIDHVFYLQLAAASCAFVTGWGMGWNNLNHIKQEKGDYEDVSEAQPTAKRSAVV